jgi:hypothetical protein
MALRDLVYKKKAGPDLYRTEIVKGIEYSLVKGTVNRMMDVSGHKSCIAVGSRRMLDQGFYRFSQHVFKDMTVQQVEDLLATSDFDIAVQLDSFALDKLLSYFPQLKLKDVADKHYDMGDDALLREVYECKIGDLFETPEYRSCYASVSHYQDRDYVKEAQKSLANAHLDILFVSDLHRMKAVWNEINTEFFAKFLWKKSPTFVGEESLKTLFRTFEGIALRAKAPVYTRPKQEEVVGMAFEVEIGAPMAAPPQPVQALNNLAPAPQWAWQDFAADFAPGGAVAAQAEVIN